MGNQTAYSLHSTAQLDQPGWGGREGGRELSKDNKAGKSHRSIGDVVQYVSIKKLRLTIVEQSFNGANS